MAEHFNVNHRKQVWYLPKLILEDGSLPLLPMYCEKTIYISVTGQDGAGKTTLRDNLANYLAQKDNFVITAKSPCDKHTVNLLNHAISQGAYSDWYTEQMLFSFMDGLISNYMINLNGHCDYFVCQRGPIDQYAHGVTRSGKSYTEIYNIQRPERLAKFDAYIHLNCNADVAWKRICDDEGKDRYEYPEYFSRQVVATERLYKEIKEGSQAELEFLRSSKHMYIDTTNLSTDEVAKKAIEFLNKEVI